MNILALEFGTNMFGNLKPEIKARLKAVIDNPCQETWNDAFSIILNSEGKMTTLWNAVIRVDDNMPKGKPCDAPWAYIPSREIIIKAINQAILKSDSKQTLN